MFIFCFEFNGLQAKFHENVVSYWIFFGLNAGPIHRVRPVGRRFLLLLRACDYILNILNAPPARGYGDPLATLSAIQQAPKPRV